MCSSQPPIEPSPHSLPTQKRACFERFVPPLFRRKRRISCDSWGRPCAGFVARPEDPLDVPGAARRDAFPVAHHPRHGPLRRECARLPHPYLFAARLTASAPHLSNQTRSLSNLLAAAAPAGIAPAVRAPSACVAVITAAGGDALGGSSDPSPAADRMSVGKLSRDGPVYVSVGAARRVEVGGLPSGSLIAIPYDTHRADPTRRG